MPKIVFEGEHLVVLERDDWQYVERKKGKSAVAIVAVTDDGQLVLTEQFRKPVDSSVIDLPAGLVGDEEGNDDPEITAKKELEEETGYTCERVEKLVCGPTSPGITSELVSIYRAHGVRKVGKGGGVGGEDIRVHLVSTESLHEWLRDRVSVDLKVWAALNFLPKSP